MGDIFQIGELLAETYEIRTVLGAGGMGQVFEAHDVVLNRRVALKVAWPDLQESVRKEAQALAAIRHPAMVQVYCVGRHGGHEFVVMERLYGVSLDAHLHRRRVAGEQLSTREVIDLLVPVCDGLMAVHRAGIAHRDIKPANIMLAPGNRVVLMDFGLFLPEFEVTNQSTVAGSPQYMAPEAIANEVEAGAGHLVDLYALGVMAYEMIAGDAPFGGEEITDVWDKHLNAPVPDLLRQRPDASPRLVQLVNDLLAKDPQNRPQSVESVLWQLVAIRDRKQEPSPRHFSVLIVDDDPEIQKVMGFYVKKAIPDADIRTARDGDSAIQAVRDRQPDVMLLDLQMPRMNGIEVCMYLQGTNLTDKCTVVAMSAGAQEHDVQLLRQLGITRFVVKDTGLREHVTEHLRELRERARNK
jgi:serine/threonine-protein kinase